MLGAMVMVMVMVTDVIVHADFKERKGKTVDHIELSIFHQRSTDLNKNVSRRRVSHFHLDVYIHRICASRFDARCTSIYLLCLLQHSAILTCLPYSIPMYQHI